MYSSVKTVPDWFKENQQCYKKIAEVVKDVNFIEKLMEECQRNTIFSIYDLDPIKAKLVFNKITADLSNIFDYEYDEDNIVNQYELLNELDFKMYLRDIIDTVWMDEDNHITETEAVVYGLILYTVWKIG